MNVSEVEQAKARAAAAYNAAADRYDDAANSFWGRFGRRTVERLSLPTGGSVLDVCCGTGASALPAAEAVGPAGHVIGVDLAQRMLENARRNAAARGLANVEFRPGDMLDLGFEERFDAVVCVFGVFFVPDMKGALRSMYACVKPGGRLAITTWGPRFFEPATSVFWEAIRTERPDLVRGFNPWDRICEPSSLRTLFMDAGIDKPHIVAEGNMHPIPSPDAWWSAVMGSGYRGTIEQLDAEAVTRVRARNEDFIRSSGVREVEANVLYAVATRATAAD
jgi:ubiquinone/menaquinone biosynthesis C-methylase UbiE